MKFIIRMFNTFIGIEHRRTRIINYQNEWIERINAVGQKLFYGATLIAFPFPRLRLIILLGILYFAMIEHEPFRKQMEQDLQAMNQNTTVLQFNRQTISKIRPYIIGSSFYIATFSYTLYRVIWN